MVITNAEQVTPQWLTETLTSAGALQRGEVTAIERDSASFNKGYLSNIATLKVSYSAEAAGTRPAHLFLKMTKPDLHPELLSRSLHEVEFYQAVAGAEVSADAKAWAGGGLATPHCYAASYDDASHLSHLLLDDLSQTHFQRPQPLPPSNQHCQLIMESLAQVHAQWWHSPRLGKEIGQPLTPAAAAASHQRLVDTLPGFMDYLGDGLLPQQRRAYETILASNFLDRQGERLIQLKDVTLIHGDAHTGNLMLPNDTARQHVVLVDWHLWDINLPTTDLAFFMALHWSAARRALLELPLLQHYHASLLALGVTDYVWEKFWNDYRSSVVIMALIPVGQFRRKSPNGVIWFGLQDSMAAYLDLHCEEVL